MNENLPTVVVHDFSGHPFQAELSRKLSERGFAVEHLSASQYVSGKGHLERQSGDAATLTFVSISLHQPFRKYAPMSRLRWERAYGRAWVEKLRQSRPTAVIACNLPLFSLWEFARHARRAELPWIMWHQDIYSHGMAGELSRRFPRPIARLGARLLSAIEARIVRSASHVVAIGDAFTKVYDEWGVHPDRVDVVPNWAPLDKIYPVERSNRRSSLLFPDNPDFRLVYAGTLGRKHNPVLLPHLVEQLRARGVDAQLAVVSEGEGAELVASSAAAAAGNVTILGFQPADDLPEVLGSADVLVALLEPDATMFSIPSKVLSYMAAGRPIVGLIPADNPAAIDIVAAGGFVAKPDAIGITSAADWLVALAADRGRITAIGAATRERAEQQFDAEQVGDRFATMIRSIATSRQGRCSRRASTLISR